jgi:hypothetical protein
MFEPVRSYTCHHEPHNRTTITAVTSLQGNLAAEERLRWLGAQLDEAGSITIAAAAESLPSRSASAR